MTLVSRMTVHDSPRLHIWSSGNVVPLGASNAVRHRVPVWRSLAAQAICNRQVVGSNPSTGSKRLRGEDLVHAGSTSIVPVP